MPLVAGVAVLALVLGAGALGGLFVSTGPAGAGSPGSSVGGGVPGSVGSAAPGDPVPTDPGDTGAEPVDPQAPLSRFVAVTRTADDRGLVVSFYGGVETCYRYAVGAAEGPQVVRLELEETRRGSQPCIELAQEYTLTVRLDEPLGVRRVVDATTGETLLGPTR